MAFFCRSLFYFRDLKFHIGVNKSLTQLGAGMGDLFKLSLEITCVLHCLELLELGDCLPLVRNRNLVFQALYLAALRLALRLQLHRYLLKALNCHLKVILLSLEIPL